MLPTSYPSQQQPDPQDSLDTPIAWFSSEDPFSTRDACEGIQVFGGIGSGKTSASGQYLALSYLAQGFGGLVLTAKPDETQRWREYAERAHRTQDLIIFSPENDFRFNAIDYERTRKGRGGGLTENIVELFYILSETSGRSSGKNGSLNEDFWEKELRKLLRNSVELLRLAGKEVTFQTVAELIQAAPRTLIEDGGAESGTIEKGEFYTEMCKACANRLDLGDVSASDAADAQTTINYWEKDYARLDMRHRASIVSSFTGMADVFLRGTLRELFCTTTNVTPEDSLGGKIIILDLPTKLFNEVGLYAQVLFKYCWQRSIERRLVRDNPRPVFLWVDESQLFVNERDVSFQTTARSALACTVFLTQNLPNYLYFLGGNEKARALTDSLLANLATKIFHNNTCIKTNHYAAELFSKNWYQQISMNASVRDGEITASRGYSPHQFNEVEPIAFTQLATGGPNYEFKAEAILHRAGRIFNHTGKNYLLTTFNQKL